MDDPYQHIADLIRQGKKIEAIKLLRETTGIGLKEAKDEVERLMAGEGPLETQGDRTDILPEEVIVLARQGKKIEAIKLLRETTGIGLKEAKAQVETITGKGSGCAGSLLLMGLAGLLVVLLFS